MPRLLFLHGGPGLDHSYFTPYFGGPEAPYEAVFYTQGFSGKPGTTGLIAELHGFVEKFLDRPLFLFAHSFGAALALEYIRRHDEKNLSGLILCAWIHDKQNWLDDYCRRFAISPRDLKNKEPKDDAEFKAVTLAASDRYYFSEGFSREGTQLWESVRFNSALYNAISREFFDDFSAADVVRSLRLPSLSIAGVNDQIVGIEHVRRGCALNAKIKSVEIGGVGHFPFVEKTAETNRSIADFLQEFKPTRSPRT